jgi:hypothetical protein
VHPSAKPWIAILLALPALAGCSEEPAPPPPAPPVAGPPASPKAIVRFKDGKRLQRDLARALELPPDALCNELDAYGCFGVHKVALGGSDAFGIGLYEPLPATGATTPIAADRVVLSACRARVDLDLSDPAGAMIWKGLELTEGGALADAGAEPVGGAIDALYRRALGRGAKPGEIEHHRALYRDVEASGKSARPARDWALLSCFSTLTTMESLFY